MATTKSAATSALRKAIGKKVSFSDGTVVKFKSAGRYTYVVLYIAVTDTWYTTGGGNYYIPGEMSTDELVSLLSSDSVSDAQVATDWEAV